MAPVKRWRRALLAALGGLLLVAWPAQAQDGSALRLLPPSGPYAVGRTAYQWIDADREEVHTPGEGDARALLVEVWYPAAPEPDALPGPYLEPAMADLFAEMLGIESAPVRALEANAVPGAPLADDQPAYPVIVFDPGFSAAPRQYTVLIEELASYGYVVFAPSHPYVTTLTVFPDGTVIEPINANALSRLWAPQDIYDAEFAEVWVPDVQFVLEQIGALNAADPAGLFTGRLDLGRLGMVGHSQGARTTSEVCLLDARCRGAVNLDGGRSAWVELGYDRPYMLILADNGVEAFVRSFESGMQAIAHDYYVLMIPRTTHISFDDIPFWAPLIAPNPEAQGVIAAQRVLLDYRTYIHAFLDKHVLGLDVPLLDGPSAEYPEVFFLVRTEPITPPTADAVPQPAPVGASAGVLAAGKADVWLYQGRAGETVSLWLMADRPAGKTTAEQRIEYGLLDTLLVVRAPDGSLLAVNDDTRFSTDSALENLVLPVDGEYQIEVRSWENQTAGGYTLLIETDRAD